MFNQLQGRLRFKSIKLKYVCLKFADVTTVIGVFDETEVKNHKKDRRFLNFRCFHAAELLHCYRHCRKYESYYNVNNLYFEATFSFIVSASQNR